MSEFDKLRQDLANAAERAEDLQFFYEGEGIEWLPMSETPDEYGYYLVLAEAFGHFLCEVLSDLFLKV